MGRNKEGSSNLVGATHKAALKHDICAWVSGKKSYCFDWTHLTEIDQKVVTGLLRLYCSGDLS